MTATTLPRPSEAHSSGSSNLWGGQAAFYSDTLRELTELGMGLARRAAAAPDGDAPAVPDAAAVAVFERAALIVRRTVRLAHHIATVQAVPRPATVRELAATARQKEIAAFEARSPASLTDSELDRWDELERLEALERGDDPDADESAEAACEVRADVGRPGGAVLDGPAGQAGLDKAASGRAAHGWVGVGEPGEAGPPGESGRTGHVGPGRPAADTS